MRSKAGSMVFSTGLKRLAILQLQILLALVELQDGKVVAVDISDIRFFEPPPSEVPKSYRMVDIGRQL